MTTTKKNAVNITVPNGLSLRQRFEKAGLSLDAIACTISGFTKSSNEKTGDVYTFTMQIINKDNKIELFVGKIFAGKSNAEHVKNTADYFAAFKAGDYVVRNASLRVQGEPWQDNEGNNGVYNESYIAVPFVSDLLILGNGVIMNNKESEIKLAKLALATVELETE